jgi:hypothetical protein
MASSSSTTNTSPSPPPPPPTSSAQQQGNTINTTNPIGYCHTCDRQVEIDKNDFVCKQCNGGFIELFEMSANTNADESDDIDDDGPNSQHINIQINEGVSFFFYFFGTL